MGLIGRYIDALPDEARDRVIEAQAGCSAVGIAGSARCLRGHAEDFYLAAGVVYEIGCPVDHADKWDAAKAFDDAVRRFAIARVVRACKLRAGRPNRIALPAKVRADA
jgi:hypothetical protein